MTTPYCDFWSGGTKQPVWVHAPYGSKSKKWQPPKHGESGDRPTVRCPKCNRRLQLKAVYCDMGGEFVNWKIPEHKPRVTKAKSPKRKQTKPSRHR